MPRWVGNACAHDGVCRAGEEATNHFRLKSQRDFVRRQRVVGGSRSEGSVRSLVFPAPTSIFCVDGTNRGASLCFCNVLGLLCWAAANDSIGVGGSRSEGSERSLDLMQARAGRVHVKRFQAQQSQGTNTRSARAEPTTGTHTA